MAMMLISLAIAIAGLAPNADLAEESALTLPARVYAEFFDADESRRWATINDNVMGGRSEGGPSFSTGLMTFSGSTNTNGGGFSSIRRGARDWDVDGADGMLVRVRGDGRTYIAALRTNVRMRGFSISYWQEFRTTDDGQWQTVRLPFDEFYATYMGFDVSDRVPRLDTDELLSFGLYIYDKKDGPFELDVAWVGSYAHQSAGAEFVSGR